MFNVLIFLTPVYEYKSILHLKVSDSKTRLQRLGALVRCVPFLQDFTIISKISDSTSFRSDKINFYSLTIISYQTFYIISLQNSFFFVLLNYITNCSTNIEMFNCVFIENNICSGAEIGQLSLCQKLHNFIIKHWLTVMQKITN